MGKEKKTINKAPQEENQTEHKGTRRVQSEKTVDHKQSEKNKRESGTALIRKKKMPMEDTALKNSLNSTRRTRKEKQRTNMSLYGTLNGMKPFLSQLCL